MAKKPVSYFVVDAFTESAFKGNPAAVCLLEEEKEEEWLQSVAREFNLSETCYLSRIPDPPESEAPDGTPIPRFHLRWFTPVTEAKLCGHATMAAAHTLFSSTLADTKKIDFLTLSGVLTAKKVTTVNQSDSLNHQNDQAVHRFFIELDFPVDPLVDYSLVEHASFEKILNGASAVNVKRTSGVEDLLVELSSWKDLVDFQPQLAEIIKLPGRGFIITAIAPPGSGFDFYSRFFCPKHGIDEDPVCGSAHCALAPYWCEKLGKHDLAAYQASPRGGIVHLHLDERNQRVFLRGEAVTVMQGTLLV